MLQEQEVLILLNQVIVIMVIVIVQMYQATEVLQQALHQVQNQVRVEEEQKGEIKMSTLAKIIGAILAMLGIGSKATAIKKKKVRQIDRQVKKVQDIKEKAQQRKKQIKKAQKKATKKKAPKKIKSAKKAAASLKKRAAKK